MTVVTYDSWADWIKRGSVAPHILTLKSAGTTLHMVEAVRPRGDLSRMALPSVVINQDLARKGRGWSGNGPWEDQTRPA